MKPLQAIFMLLSFVMLLGSREDNLTMKTTVPMISVRPDSVSSLPAPAPKYFKSALRLTMAPQNGNTCLPSIMGYINQELCRGSYSTKHYVEQYETDHPGVDVEEIGIVGSKKVLREYIEANFQTLSYMEAGGIVASIDSGHPLITTILSFDNTGAEQLHSILIVGYDSSAKNNPKVYYMDSRYGRIFNDIDVAGFNASSPAYTYSIKGCK